MMHTRRIWLPAALLLFAVAASPSGAAIQQRPAVVAGIQAKITGYMTRVVVVSRGEDVTFHNFDLEKHDVVQDVATDGFGSKKRMPWCDKKKKGDGHAHHHHEECPIFWSELIGLGDSTRILGLKNVKPGETYSFFCTLHHSMKGILVVR